MFVYVGHAVSESHGRFGLPPPCAFRPNAQQKFHGNNGRTDTNGFPFFIFDISFAFSIARSEYPTRYFASCKKVLPASLRRLREVAVFRNRYIRNRLRMISFLPPDDSIYFSLTAVRLPNGYILSKKKMERKPPLRSLPPIYPFMPKMRFKS